MKICKVIIIIFISLFFVSCSNSEKLTTLEKISNLVSFKKDAINIQYKSVNELNFYESNIHSLVFTIYQLNDINNFNLLIKEPKELGKLMSGIKFDSTVLSFEQFHITPNNKDVITIDRVKGAKWIVLLAGYYDYDRKEDVYIPFQSKVKEKSWYDFSGDNIEYNVLDVNVLFDKNKLIAEVLE